MNVVLALNSGKDQFGDLARETKDRADAAMTYAAGRLIGPVVMVGGDAVSMADYAANRFPDGPQTVAEAESWDTIEGAHITKLTILKPNGFHQVDIFTSDFHAPRAAWIYTRVLGDDFDITVHPVATDYLMPDKLKWVRRREQVQLGVARLKLLGVGSEDDARREQRLKYFRYRHRDNFVAQMLAKADDMTNINRQ